MPAPAPDGAPARRRLAGHDPLDVSLQRHLVDRPGGGGVGGVPALQRQHFAPQPPTGAAELADLEHLGAVVGAGVGGREDHRPGDRGAGHFLPAAWPAGAVGALVDAVEVGAHLAGPQRRELLARQGAGPQVALLLVHDDVDAVELREVDGDVAVGHRAHLRAAVVVVEDPLVGPALEGVAQRPELAHAPAVAETVADEVYGRPGERHGRPGADRQHPGQGDDGRGERPQQPTPPDHGARTRSTAERGGRCDVSAPRKRASPKMAMPPLASAM